MLLGVIIGVLSSITRMYCSYYYNLPSGPGMVLVASVIFVLALLFSSTQEILTNPSMNFGSSIFVK